MRKSIGRFIVGVCVAAALAALGCDNSGAGSAPGAPGERAKPKLAYITNGVAPFWTIAEKGVIDGAKEVDAEVSVVMPSDVNDQMQRVEDLLIRGVDGIAISPIDAENQVPLLNKAAAKTKLITQDSDAPKSDRIVYIGIDNYVAGRMAGQLVKEAIPGGGKVAILVGRLEGDNARKRRQGVLDELLDRKDTSGGNDPLNQELKGAKYTIIATLTDQIDAAKAKSNAEDMMSAHPDLVGLIGLNAYHTPALLEAVKQAGKMASIRVVGFDEQDATLRAIQDGEVVGTVVQNPYMYGKESVRVLAALVRGDTSVVPPGEFISLPARQIRKSNLPEFWADLKQKAGKAE
ncbi:sugar ABC transporter substrate-binding protein [Sorangium cellulosum]|uniref:Sugar ABC transporter substrate-binding protein n=2 Tax=Sorangium cellulosum TaxID=56 RepID=A0A150PNN0_SORCE|nr:sugar-binding protein [Sorangium cellulosum]AGP37327.1 sugar ABC transporter substrate-binding protein [Sorangium cellulosum So0157-2]KYF57304.1 sugar ABC transporter substrate-binding protein [Sorangium cellulosum]